MNQAAGPVLADTFPKLLVTHAKERSAATAFRHKRRGIWQAVTWAEAYRLVAELAAGFAELGIQRGDRVAIAGGNSPHSYCSITAIQALGAIPVMLHAELPGWRLAKLLAGARASVAIVEGQEQADNILVSRSSMPSLRTVLYYLDRGMRDYDPALFRSLEDVRRAGQAWLAGAGHADWFESQVSVGRPSDIACILYTVGAAGAEQGACFLSGRCVEAARASAERDDLRPNDLAFAHLSPATVDDFYFVYAQALVAGACVACPESQETAPSDLREIGATFHSVSPQQLKELMAQVNIRISGAGPVRRWIFRHFIDAAEKRHDTSPAGGLPFASRMHHVVGNFLIYGPLKSALGLSRIRTMYVTEAVSPKLLRFYRSIGLNLKRFYGRTEAFYQIAVQPEHSRGSLKLTPGVTLRLSAANEIEFRSPGMFAGYLDGNGRCCDAPITDDGFFRSGDLGVLDDDGGLTIAGRVEDVGRLVSGQSFSPGLIERRLRESPFISDAMVFGDGYEFVVGLIIIDFAVVRDWAARHGVLHVSLVELASNPAVIARLTQEIVQANSELQVHPSGLAADVRRFALLPGTFEADTDEPPLVHQLKRQLVARRYRAIIDALARGDGCAPLDVERLRCEDAPPRVHLHGVHGRAQSLERLTQ